MTQQGCRAYLDFIRRIASFCQVFVVLLLGWIREKWGYPYIERYMNPGFPLFAINGCRIKICSCRGILSLPGAEPSSALLSALPGSG